MDIEYDFSGEGSFDLQFGACNSDYLIRRKV